MPQGPSSRYGRLGEADFDRGQANSAVSVAAGLWAALGRRRRQCRRRDQTLIGEARRQGLFQVVGHELFAARTPLAPAAERSSAEALNEATGRAVAYAPSQDNLEPATCARASPGTTIAGSIRLLAPTPAGSMPSARARRWMARWRSPRSAQRAPGLDRLERPARRRGIGDDEPGLAGRGGKGRVTSRDRLIRAWVTAREKAEVVWRSPGA